jgi:uncharacterized membrane protein YecN with MAPEG domain
MNIHISLIYAALLGLIFVALSFRVIRHRVGTRVVFGDGGNTQLSIAIRTHGNFIEYVPLALLLIMGVELVQYPSSIVHSLGIVLVLARLGHILGLASQKGVGMGRPAGTIATLLVLVLSSAMILLKSF